MDNMVNGRIVLKHDTEANWNKVPEFIPMLGEAIIFDMDDNYSYQRIKIGDGINNLNALPFFNDLKKIETAISDLNEKSLRRVIFSAIVDADNWTVDNLSKLYVQDITVNGISSDDIPYVQPSRTGVWNIDDPALNAWYSISRIVTDDDRIIVYSDINSLPADIPLDIICYRQNEMIEVTSLVDDGIVDITSEHIVATPDDDVLNIDDDTNTVSLI